MNRRAAYLIAVAAAMLLLAAPAHAAGPQFNLYITHAPDQKQGEGPTLTGGGPITYTLKVTNTGDDATSAPIVLTDTLGEGLTFSAVEPGPSFSCSGDASLATPLTCTRTTPLGAGQADSIHLSAAVAEVETDKAETTTTAATVSGGGVPVAVSNNYTVAVYPRYAPELFFSRTTTSASEATAYTAAGGHPFQNVNGFQYTHWGIGKKINITATEDIKDAFVTLPPGFIGNPAAAPRCLSKPASSYFPSNCPPGSRVGDGYPATFNPLCIPCDGGLPIYNIVPDYGYPAQFYFITNTTPVILSGILHPRTEDYAISIGSLNTVKFGVVGFGARFYGVPGDHLPEGSEEEPSEIPFLSNPVDCSNTDPLWKLTSNSWQNVGAFRRSGLPDTSDPKWLTATSPAPPVTGCDDPSLASQFNSDTIATKPLQGPGPVEADSPAGLAIDLDFPQSNDPTDPEAAVDPSIPQAPPLKDITLKLPAGLSLSASSAEGLTACSDLASDPAGDQVHYDTTDPVTCPDSSKIGSATATSPLLANRDPVTDEVNGAVPIPGDVYLLKPHEGDLPIGGGSSDGKFRLLIELEHARYGTNIKLPGVAVADKQTGQLTATFLDNPQLPSKHLTVSLRSGPRAPLATPVSCGKFTTTAHLVPWGTPDVPDADKSANFDVGAGPNGGPCPASEAARPFAPSIKAGTATNRAGASSPFTLRIDRRDGEKELGNLALTLPEGLLAKLAGIPACSDAALSAAAARSGKAEQADPTCPASRIGSVTVGAGPGTNPLQTQSAAFLAGPYKGAPLSVAVITPTVAGPFDLGTIVVRNALYLNPATSQARIVSDPLPTIIDGIPLRLRSILVELDRPDFTLNPTDCTATSINVALTSADGSIASPSAPYRVGGCKDLGFKPDLKLALKGKVSRRSHPSLTATLVARPGDANIAAAQVRLPKAAFLDNAHIGQVCTRGQFSTHACPEGSIYGTATVTTPLLDYPLSGNVYLRSSSNKLPDLVAGFNGPSRQPIEFELSGKTDSVKGALRNTFEAVPDVPVTDFHLTLFGGKRGLIIMSSGFCANPRADIKFTGQNGMQFNTTPKVAAKCPKKKFKKSSGNKRSQQR